MSLLALLTLLQVCRRIDQRSSLLLFTLSEPMPANQTLNLPIIRHFFTIVRTGAGQLVARLRGFCKLAAHLCSSRMSTDCGIQAVVGTSRAQPQTVGQKQNLKMQNPTLQSHAKVHAAHECCTSLFRSGGWRCTTLSAPAVSTCTPASGTHQLQHPALRTLFFTEPRSLPSEEVNVLKVGKMVQSLTGQFDLKATLHVSQMAWAPSQP